MTVTVRASANGMEAPTVSHATMVTAPPASAITVSHTAARFARSCERERDSWAWRTIVMTCAR